MIPEQETNPTFRWDVRIQDSLRKPITKLAIDSDKEIRQIVSEAVRDYLKKTEQEKKAGEF